MSDEGMHMPGDDEATAAAITVLVGDVGTWDTELVITPYPGADPIRTRGTAVNRLVGGRWLVSDQATDSGFEGHGVYGWDPAAGIFVSVWVDAMGGGIARGTGTWNARAATMTYEVAVDFGGHTVTYTEITERHADGSRTYRHVAAIHDGGSQETIRGTYRRRA
jgi:Protein of unknown function (DUF1579)